MEVGSLRIRVIKKDIKNIHLAVYPPNGTIRLASPRNVKDDTLRLFVISKIGWIRKQQRRFQRQDREGVKEYIERESHYYLGKRYLLKVVEKSAVPCVSISNKFIVVQARPGATPAKRQEILEQWYRGQLKEVIFPLIDKWEKTIGVKSASWSVRKMRTKWGTCNTDLKRISFNLELVKKPIECVQFVVVHELVHLLERRHNATFLGYLDKYLSNWQRVKRKLNVSILNIDAEPLIRGPAKMK
ncbi:MAG: SprT family zinc-dependent metalloprotease [Cyclobacteriaceae bacterium]